MAVDKLVDSTQLDADLTSVANAIRTKGGTSASLAFPAGFVSAVESIETGGGSKANIDIGVSNTPISNIINMFYALEQGTAKTGEFTLPTAIRNTESRFLSTGLSVIHGFFVADTSIDNYQTASTPENVLFSFLFCDTNGTAKYAITRHTVGLTSLSGSGNVTKAFLIRCTYRWDGGDLYLTGAYDGNNSYTPFHSGRTYRWVAW